MRYLKLPKGLRLEVVDNTNLRLEVGTRVTIDMNQTLDLTSYTMGVSVFADGPDKSSFIIPFNQCEIVGDNFKKTFKDKSHIDKELSCP